MNDPKKKSSGKPADDKSAGKAPGPEKVIGGQPESDHEAREAGVESATSSKPKRKE